MDALAVLLPGMAGLAEAAAAQVVAVALLAVTAGGILLVVGCVFRSVVAVSVAAGLCMLLAVGLGPAAFTPPPDTDDPDAHHWYAADRTVGWYALGLAFASVGSLGLVVSNPRRATARAGGGRIPATLACRSAWWLLQVGSAAPLLGGVGVVVVSGPPCCLLVLVFIGIACVGLIIPSPND